jgi:hypothetical protein
MIPLASPIVDWGSLGKVAIASLAIGVAVTVILALGIAANLIASDETREGQSGASIVGLRALTVLSVVVVLAAIVLGILTIAGFNFGSLFSQD